MILYRQQFGGVSSSQKSGSTEIPGQEASLDKSIRAERRPREASADSAKLTGNGSEAAPSNQLPDQAGTEARRGDQEV